jgi:hypothetical protein
MLSEFSRTGATTLGDKPETTDRSAQAKPEPTEYVAQRDLADTASLLRELSSLGFEDEPPIPSGPRPNPGTGQTAPRPVAATRKRRGLFGR